MQRPSVSEEIYNKININKKEMAYSEDLHIYRDTFLLCKLLMGYSKHVTKMIRFGQYEACV